MLTKNSTIKISLLLNKSNNKINDSLSLKDEIDELQKECNQKDIKNK